MNHPFRSVLSALLTFFLVLSCSNPQPEQQLSPEEFRNPPVAVQVHTWWHWLDGGISKDGITKDLEAMKTAGISQATILNIGLFGPVNLGVSRVVFNTPEWHEMFNWALQEADRLGIKIGAHNCDGWSSSGGPWITPETSMKQYTWSKTLISGGKAVKLALPTPAAMMDFYRDVAVVAYKTPGSSNSYQLADPVVLLNGESATGLQDGNPLSNVPVNTGDKIQIRMKEPFTASKIVIYQRKTFSWGSLNSIHCTYQLSSSNDGKKYQPVKTFTVDQVNEPVSIDLPVSTARFYELAITGLQNVYPEYPFSLAEMELLGSDEKAMFSPGVSKLAVKTVFVKSEDMKDFSPEFTSAPENLAHPEVIDLSSKFSSEGILSWDAPEGNWMIIRFGYTTTAAVNGPATEEGRGLECDKMDTAALNLHFNSFPLKLVHSAGKYAGNTFKFILIDSWECGFQNWTGNFSEEFKNRRGYDILPWIPLLCGEKIDNAENSEAFLYDFRTTISDLIDQNYYRHFRDLCHEYKIEMHAEPIYGGPGYPPLDVMKANDYPDLNMWEFWAGHNWKTSFPEYTPSPEPNTDFPALATTAYGKGILGAESYTAQAHYSESPWDLKPFGDRAYCSGVNQFILHSYVHQPTDRKPGVTLLRWGSHFNRNNLYFTQIADWMQYHARVQSVLQKGSVSAKILGYTGDQLPQSAGAVKAYPLPFGYQYAAINPELLGKLEVRKGKLYLPSGNEYALLTLPPTERMELSTLKLIAKLVKAGALVYGPPPSGTLSLKNHSREQQDLKELASAVWGANPAPGEIRQSYGDGMVYWGMPLAQVIRERKLLPDFCTNAQDSLKLMFIHKIIPEGDVFFVFNQTETELQRECLFRVGNSAPEIWDPETGEIVLPGLYTVVGKQLRMPVVFGARQSLIFVFRKGVERDSYSSVSNDGIQLFPAGETPAETKIPCVYYIDGQLQVQAERAGKYRFSTRSGNTLVVDAPGMQEYEVKQFIGTLEYSSSYDTTIPAQKIDKLVSWTSSSNQAIRYFSGNGKYTLHFKVPEEFLNTGDSLWLSPGEVGVIARLILNGKLLGTAWKPGKRFRVNGLLKQENELVVEVANVYRNRIIGDYIQYGKIQTVWTPAPVEEYLDKSKPLKPSGLIGPVSLYRIGTAK